MRTGDVSVRYRYGINTQHAHQEFVCTIMLLTLPLLASATVGLTEWWTGSWALLQSGSRPLASLGRHSIYATFAVELKDCFEYERMTPPFWVHHLATFAGLGMCLFVNAGAGLVTTTGVVAEIGSGFYNLLSLWPQSRLALFAYVLVMNGSNAFATVCLHEVITGLPALHTGFRVAWSTLCILLLLLRTGGVLLQLRRVYCPPAKPPPSLKSEKAQSVASIAVEMTSDDVEMTPDTVEMTSDTVDIVDVVGDVLHGVP